MKTDFSFEFLCVDKTGKTVIKTVENFKHALLANSNLWKSPSSQATDTICDQALKVKIALVDSEDETDQQLKRAFLINIKGPFEDTEKLRIPIIDYSKELKFEPIYVVLDEVSERIASQLYPGIHQVENKLRGYLIKFFIKKLGPNWWKVTADSDMNRKAKARNVESRVLTTSLDSSAYLIDFGDLGRIVFQQISGFLSRDDIIKRIRNMDESVNSIRILKEEIETNYTKFFNDAFRIKDFQKKWEDLEKIRHKVAHNNLFTQNQCEIGENLIKELLEIIDEADSGVEDIQFSDLDRDAIRESIVEHSAFDIISEDKLLEELKSQYEQFLSTDGFVGLSHFVKNHLGILGFDFRSSYELISLLEKKGLVEIYKVDNPVGDYEVSAIRPLKKQSDSSPDD
ncbi:hypothetical protein [Desulfobacter latus]|uniref:Apea-like HEPN domain-containing protein n=1 Tax=Desulfobacter latus TaxID=2292 RepID=A0A850STI6_9BACT|nr:hypothetical protein [Desulfobacter latus]NWH04684.1 hypothetical protein [Desulfobacter latus]